MFVVTSVSQHSARNHVFSQNLSRGNVLVARIRGGLVVCGRESVRGLALSGHHIHIRSADRFPARVTRGFCSEFFDRNFFGFSRLKNIDSGGFCVMLFVVVSKVVVGKSSGEIVVRNHHHVVQGEGLHDESCRGQCRAVFERKRFYSDQRERFLRDRAWQFSFCSTEVHGHILSVD